MLLTLSLLPKGGLLMLGWLVIAGLVSAYNEYGMGTPCQWDKRTLYSVALFVTAWLSDTLWRSYRGALVISVLGSRLSDMGFGNFFRMLNDIFKNSFSLIPVPASSWYSLFVNQINSVLLYLMCSNYFPHIITTRKLIDRYTYLIHRDLEHFYDTLNHTWCRDPRHSWFAVDSPIGWLYHLFAFQLL